MGRNRQETFGIFAKQIKMNGQHQQNNILHECLHLVHMDGVTKTSTIRNNMKGKIPRRNRKPVKETAMQRIFYVSPKTDRYPIQIPMSRGRCCIIPLSLHELSGSPDEDNGHIPPICRQYLWGLWLWSYQSTSIRMPMSGV